MIAMAERKARVTAKSIKKGETVGGACPDPRFAGAFFGEDIDWTEQPAVGISEDAARSLVADLSPSLVQAAANAMGAHVEAWRLRGIAKRAIGTSSQPYVIDWAAVPLGQKRDIEIAQELGVNRAVVSWARRQRKIKPWRRYVSGDIDWSKVPLGKEPDDTIAKRLGVSRPVVKRARVAADIPTFQRKINWASFPLGKIPDGEVAKMIGCVTSAVQAARNRLGIHPFYWRGRLRSKET